MAYTKYSLTPANNTAAPPDGAPEGMLPSAVNDTMRDMMAQIRDVGDGVRDGTYTMTAPKITGGTITGVALTGNTFTSPVISGGTINNATIGATTATTGKFTTLEATGATTFSGATVVSGSLTANTFSSSGATITGGSITGITDLAVADGGTGASSFTSGALLKGAGTSAITTATAGTDYAGIDTAQTFTKGQRGEITALTDAATITPDMADSNNFSVTLGGNRTLANPSNIVAGQSGSFFITQDGTGSRTLAYGSYYDFAGGTAPTLSTTASAVDRIDYVVRTSTSIHCVFTANYS